MRILNRKQFLALEGEHVYAEYTPAACDHIKIKYKNCKDNDWYYQDLCPSDIVESNGCMDMSNKLDEMEADSNVDHALDYNLVGRDGSFKNEQLFAVLSADDVKALIERLSRVVK